MRDIRAGSELVERATQVLSEALEAHLRQRPRVSFAVSGGRTPWPVFRQLAEASIEWSRVDIYQVDERVAPAGHLARNLSGLNETLLELVPATAHPMPVEGDDLDAATAHYASELPERLDVVHLGLGDDGHTASLVPGDPVLEVADRRVAITHPYRGHCRMTLTYPALNAARTIVWIVSGADKAAMLRRLRDADPTIPAGRISQDHAILITDEVEDRNAKESP
jgi:6-phosphogluconolactonase